MGHPKRASAPVMSTPKAANDNEPRREVLPILQRAHAGKLMPDCDSNAQVAWTIGRLYRVLASGSEPVTGPTDGG